MLRRFESGFLPSGVFFIAVVLLVSIGHASAATETVLWSFGNVPDGGMTGTKISGVYYNEDVNGVLPGLISDAAGNLYGTTPLGGTSGPHQEGGTVFKLSPPAQAGGAWSESVLYNFGGYASDGLHPWGGVTMDPNGNLFGTTFDGGASGKGTVFELSPPTTPGGKWTESILLSFDVSDGANPVGRLLLDASSNIYGTTGSGGGTAFELSPPSSSNSNWTETILATYADSGIPGAECSSGLISDTSGNLYCTGGGGINNGGYGTAFELFPPSVAGGNWGNSILWSFGVVSTDGQSPRAGLIMDSAGDLFGSTSYGGSAGRGIVFELSPSGGGWSETILSAFTGNFSPSGTAPAEADGGVVMNANGNLFGTTTNGGTAQRGTVFALVHLSTPGGPWAQTILWNFGSNGGGGKAKTDGTGPESHLLLDSSGNLYGTTHTGGAYGRGTVYRISNTGL